MNCDEVYRFYLREGQKLDLTPSDLVGSSAFSSNHRSLFVTLQSEVKDGKSLELCLAYSSISLADDLRTITGHQKIKTIISGVFDNSEWWRLTFHEKEKDGTIVELKPGNQLSLPRSFKSKDITTEEGAVRYLPGQYASR